MVPCRNPRYIRPADGFLVGTDIGMSTRGVRLKALRKFSVHTILEGHWKEITDRGVSLEKDDTHEFLEADTIVLAIGNESNPFLYHQLDGKVDELYLIGDAPIPRNMLAAIHEAFDVARQI